MMNLDYLVSIYEHRIAFRYVTTQLIKESSMLDVMMDRASRHDMDKMLLCTLSGIQTASDIHNKISRHHMENNVIKTSIDIIEAVINYECMGYTKAGKCKYRNAYDTVLELRPNHSEELLKTIADFGINKHYLNTPNNVDWLKYRGEGEVTQEIILREVYNYCVSNPGEVKKLLSHIE